MNNEPRAAFSDGILTINLSGQIDSSNAGEIEEKINALRAPYAGADIVIDAEELKYISSAGLRVILRIKKSCPSAKVINVSSEVYDIFDITGFTEMMTIEKAYRKISIEGCEVIGQGANGKVYRIDPDTIVKVYFNSDALPDIRRETALARKAFVKGIPTAIPYDIVRVGDNFGSVFELLNAKSFSKLIASDPDSVDKVIDMYVDLLKKIHSVELEPGDMPDQKETFLNWAAFLEGHLPDDVFKKLYSLAEAIPENHHMLHGDYHTKNVMLQNDEVLLIDMDTLCMGDPAFEFGGIYNAYIGFGELGFKGSTSEDFLGIPQSAADRIFDRSIRLYLDTQDEKKIEQAKQKSIVIGQTRLLRRTIRRLSDTEHGKAQIARSKQLLCDIVPTLDDLCLF